MQAFIIGKQYFQTPTTSRRQAKPILYRYGGRSSDPAKVRRSSLVRLLSACRYHAITENNSRRIGESDPSHRATDRRPRGFAALATDR